MSATTETPEIISARNGHSQCLLCGTLNPRSLHLTFQASEDGGVRTRFKACTELQGYDDLLHGGVIASLLDAAMTHCLFYQGIKAVTGDLHVRFVQPVFCNATLELRARILSSRPPLYRLRAEAVLGERVMAWAEAKFLPCREPR
ncbi:PaaI family thioesterase [candidate division KSB1 bacterium]|nr:MAG: PaaI family thioesterase [candidate division KSB1 bacterium]